MQIPLQNIIEKIEQTTGLSEEDIQKKINSKLEELAGLVSQEGAAHIVANELNVKLFDDEPLTVKISDIKPFMRNIAVVGKVTNIFDLIEFEKNSSPGKVRTCILGDETGKIRASFWHEATKALEDVKEGDIIKVNKASSRDNNGRAEISTSFFDQIEINPEGVDITVTDVTMDPKIKKIVELGKDSYGAIMGTVVQSFKPSFFYSCPECRKKLKEEGGKKLCAEHGEVEPQLGYVLNIVIDDGTETMRCVLFNEQVETLSGKDKAFFKEMVEDTKKTEELQKSLIGLIVKAVGRIRFNSFSNTNEIVASKIESEIDVEKELEQFAS